MQSQSWMSKFRVLLVLSALLSATPAFAAETITFTTRGAAYLVDKQVNPDLSLQRGITYDIKVKAPGHPLWIKTVQGAGVDNAYTNGVSGNGTTDGTITFTVPADAPPQLFYNCQVHPTMTGRINITD